MKIKKNLFIYILFDLFILIAGISFSVNTAYALLKWQADYNKAIGLLKNKKYNSALKISKEALKESKNPETYELVNYLLTGNNFLRSRKINSAVMLYKEGLKYANDKHLSDILMLNMAMGYENSRLKRFKKAIYYSSRVIKNNPKNSFTYFIKGMAEYGLNELSLSLQDLKAAYKLNPKSKMIKNAIYVVKKDITDKKHKEIKNIKQSSENLFK